MKIFFYATLIICMTAASCGTAKNKKISLVPRATADCQVARFPLSYTLTSPPKLIKGKILPKKYSTYLVSKAELKQFFVQIKNGNNDQIAFPLPDACVTFSLKNSNAMDASLAAKYPEIMSLKGRSSNPDAQEARIDYDGNKLKAQIGYNRKTYILEPYTETADKIVYLLWDKDDTGYPKAKFE